jgi:REP element-mobilizing transposase RayT
MDFYMARRLRVEFPGAIYHLINRGDRRENIFRDDADREKFLETLGETCAKTDWQVHAYCLMRNHFHLVVETPQPNLVAGMKWFLGTYTSRFNRRHKLSGHVFSGRYKSLLVGGQGGYLRTVCEYVHLNPVRARLVGPEESLCSYRWSSYPHYLQPPSRRTGWLRVDRLFGELGIPQDSAAGRRQLGLRMEERRAQEQEAEFKAIRRGWCFGDEQFRRELLQQMGERMGRYHYGPEVQESAQQLAERILAEELGRRKWTDQHLAMERKGHPTKIAIAQRLRAETTMTLEWIAQRLQMGTKTHLAHLLYWEKQEKRPNRMS